MLAPLPLNAAHEELAPAKINLALHVIGQREDGYHLLETLVTFADTGDRLFFSPAQEDRFSLSGRFAAGLAEDQGTNLVLKARDMLRDAAGAAGVATPPVAIHLEKNLPLASGIGGGSADAAATLRALCRLWQFKPADTVMNDIALSLGADLPMCLNGTPLVARGIGEELEQVVGLPAFALVLANPLEAVSTPSIFRNLASRNNPGFGRTLPSQAGEWHSFIGELRNDLEPTARQLCPSIALIATALQEAGAATVRMSGSGATCFGLFSSQEEASSATDQLRHQYPRWYFMSATTVAS